MLVGRSLGEVAALTDSPIDTLRNCCASTETLRPFRYSHSKPHVSMNLVNQASNYSHSKALCTRKIKLGRQPRAVIGEPNIDPIFKKTQRTVTMGLVETCSIALVITSFTANERATAISSGHRLSGDVGEDGSMLAAGFS